MCFLFPVLCQLIAVLLVTKAFLFKAHGGVEKPLVVDSNASTGTQRTISTGKKFLVNPEQVDLSLSSCVLLFT
jgi:hypothetical protein